MKLYVPGRRREPEVTPDAGADLTAQLAPATGKGRPTPRRNEAQGRRTGPPPPPPTTRKEAYKRMRANSSSAAAGQRDERALPVRDQGPRRALVRNIVDSRRNVGSVFLGVAVVLLVSLVAPPAVKGYATMLMLLFFVLLVVDSVLLGRRIRKIVDERFPDHPEKTGTLVFYGINRTTLPRRWRFPKAQVAPGAQI